MVVLRGWDGMIGDAMVDRHLEDEIRKLLVGERIAFREISHPAARTAQEIAHLRGEPLAIGGKSLVLKVDDAFALFVVSADRRLASREVRRAVGARRSRFATEEELLRLTGCTPGCVPPFGPPVLPLPLHAHVSVREQPNIAFTPGVPTVSFVCATADWARAARPRFFGTT